MPEKVLVIDDDEIVREVLTEHLKNDGYEVIGCSNGYRGLELFKNDRFDLVVLDLLMPGINGIEVLKEIKRFSPHSIVILITAFGSIENAVDAMRAGAFDYITKPFNLSDVSFAVKRGIDVSKLEKENINLKRQLKSRYGFENIIGDSNAMQSIYSLIDKVAPTDSTVLILGESGTGKELIANIIHYNSERSSKPIVTVNCSAIPHELLESELFGHERGAFTGAVSTKPGKFEISDGGTLFLDEIGEMSLSLQVKLLRVLQEKTFERVGGTKSIKVDVRIISATNKNLEDEVKTGRFREDLYYRLNVIPIQLPPLRARAEDISLLCRYFIDRYCKKRKKPFLKISGEAMSALMNYSWPGNVRELENLIERLVVLKEDLTVSVNDLPEKIVAFIDNNINFKASINYEISNGAIDFGEKIKDYEKYIISRALKSSRGIKSKAARLLNLKRTTLIEKMKRLSIPE
jgi:DNA-binding NtrC family response regulator